MQQHVTISNKMIGLIEKIARLRGRLDLFDREEEKALNELVYKAVIEKDSSITLQFVDKVLSDEPVAAKPSQIRIIQNSATSFQLASSLNPFNMQDFFTAYHLMNEVPLVLEPRDLSALESVFSWITTADLPDLIKMCYLKYEISSIQPDSPMMKKMTSYWMRVALNKWDSRLTWLPFIFVSNESARGNVHLYVENTLQMIYRATSDYVSEVENEMTVLSDKQQQLINLAGVTKKIRSIMSDMISDMVVMNDVLESEHDLNHYQNEEETAIETSAVCVKEPVLAPLQPAPVKQDKSVATGQLSLLNFKSNDWTTDVAEVPLVPQEKTSNDLATLIFQMSDGTIDLEQTSKMIQEELETPKVMDDKQAYTFESLIENLKVENLSENESAIFDLISDYIKENGYITNGVAVRLLDKSEATVRRYLSKFTLLNLLQAEGERKSRKYYLKEQIA